VQQAARVFKDVRVPLRQEQQEELVFKVQEAELDGRADKVLKDQQVHRVLKVQVMARHLSQVA